MSEARNWIATASEREGEWRDHGPIGFPSGSIFVGDPTWGDDYHMSGNRPAPRAPVRVWSFAAQDGTNYAVWLEASGATPTQRGEALEFGVDAAVFALGDVGTGEAFVALGERQSEAAKGDSFDWITPHIQASPNFAKWLPIPPDNQPMFLVTTNRDGGYAAVWLYDAKGAVSGILIDVRGRASDRKFIDVLLPDKS